ncbi:MAG: hypothetical protein WBS24_19230, partial [Terriglobales bacterium]
VRAVMRLSDDPLNPRDFNRELPLNWENAILRCLERNPTHRFCSAREVIDSLKSETVGRRRKLKKRSLASKRTMSIVAVGTVILALLFYGLRLLQEKALVPPGSQLLVTEVETPEPEFKGLTEAFKSQLSQSEHFETVDEDRVREILKQMNATSKTVNDPQVVRDLALRAGASVVVYESLSRLGGEYVFELKLERMGSTPALIRRSWKNQFTASDKRELFDAVHQAATWVRETVGEPAREIAEQDRPPRDTTTSSWPALQLFALAQERSAAQDDRAATVLLREALEADPDFASAHMRLADLLVSMNNYREGYQHWQKAIELTNKRELTSRENLRIKGQFLEDTGDLPAAEQAYREFVLHYPHDSTPLHFLGSVLDELNQDDEAVRTFQKAAAMEPNSIVAPEHLAMIYLYQHDWQAADTQIQELEKMGSKEWATWLRGFSQFLRGKPEDGLKTIAILEGASSDDWKSRSWTYEATMLGELGDYQKAMLVLRRGIAFDSAHGFTISEADKHLQLAYIFFRDGQLRDACATALKAIDLDKSPNHIMAAGLLLARSGETLQAKKLLSLLDHELDVPRNRFAKHRLKGEIALAEHNLSEALLEFQEASKLQSRKADREYLARALQEAGKAESARALRKDMYEHASLFWLYEQGESPGLWADSLSRYISLQWKMDKPEACSLMDRYFAMRSAPESKQLQSEAMSLPGAACGLKASLN